MMNDVQLDPRALDAASGLLSNEEPCFMLNLIRYRAQADYGDGSEAHGSGRDVYFARYIPAFRRLAGPGVAPLWVGTVAAGLVAVPVEQWDIAAVVRYPSFRAFRELVESAAYKQEAEPHRLAAIADWRLLASLEMPTPGVGRVEIRT